MTEHYSLGIHNPDGAPEIEESVSMGGIPLFRRRKGKGLGFIEGEKEGKDETILEKFPAGYSALLLSHFMALGNLLKNVHLYRIDPHRREKTDPIQR
uniref:Uncharacterized protein n=1 Tax=Candidatus Kentrum sp. TC TaxID=2126339 RepID=A0A450ZDZ7_9GAMM|nr:MAG: hypothetical protein BECKTC1821D_GA0114238_11502 [Candidatus Kentron sp. TC]